MREGPATQVRTGQREAAHAGACGIRSRRIRRAAAATIESQAVEIQFVSGRRSDDGLKISAARVRDRIQARDADHRLIDVKGVDAGCDSSLRAAGDVARRRVRGNCRCR